MAVRRQPKKSGRKKTPARLTTRKIIKWAGEHFKRTGKWPTVRSGIVQESPEFDWSSIDGCLEFGGFGLPGGSSLAHLLAIHRGLAAGKEKSPLSTELILVWADRHHIRTGEWPTQHSGPVTDVPGEFWNRIDAALRRGSRGLLGDSSLPQLLAEHRGVAIGRKKPRLTTKLILEWADLHHDRTGRWPTEDSGEVADAPGELWKNIDGALRRGSRRLPGGSSLPKLLNAQRNRGRRLCSTPLSIEQVLAWADEHKERTGEWPTQRSGPVKGVLGESWVNLQSSLRRGERGLPGGSSITQLLVEHRGRRPRIIAPELTLEQILEWADDHRRRTGEWPSATRSGPVRAAPHESWSTIDGALKHRMRGLSGPRSLGQLLAERRDAVIHGHKKPLTIAQILQWADEHHKRTGSWPKSMSGPVHGVEGETWTGITVALSQGTRGLRGGNSLARILIEHRGVAYNAYRPRLTQKQILEWADEHRARTGRWPSEWSGKVHGTDDEVWTNINSALADGLRGLPGGESLAKLIRRRRGEPLRVPFPEFTVKQVLALADRHKKHTGRWPGGHSGMIRGARHETWQRVDAALAHGKITCADADTLHRLLVKHRGVKLREKPDPLTIPQILRLADAYYKRMGRWPSGASGRIQGRKDTWISVDSALRYGTRGLPGGSSLTELLANERGKPRFAHGGQLDVDEILEWADDHYNRTGKWPTGSSGRVRASRKNSWKGIDEALRIGQRGLPGGNSLAKLLQEHGRKRKRDNPPRLTQAQILKWADAHRRRTGEWPRIQSGPVHGAPDETWGRINAALADGRRGLPGNDSLYLLLRRRRKL